MVEPFVWRIAECKPAVRQEAIAAYDEHHGLGAFGRDQNTPAADQFVARETATRFASRLNELREMANDNLGENSDAMRTAGHPIDDVSRQGANAAHKVADAVKPLMVGPDEKPAVYDAFSNLGG